MRLYISRMCGRFEPVASDFKNQLLGRPSLEPSSGPPPVWSTPGRRSALTQRRTKRRKRRSNRSATAH